MNEQITGVIQQLGLQRMPKSYSVKMDDGQWYSAFAKNGNLPFGVEQGNQVTVEYQMNGQYRNIKKIYASSSSAAPAPSAPAAAPSAAQSDYKTKEDTRQREIRFHASRNSAIALTSAMLQAGALKLPAKQADQADAVTAFVDNLTKDYYLEAEHVSKEGVQVDFGDDAVVQ